MRAAFLSAALAGVAVLAAVEALDPPAPGVSLGGPVLSDSSGDPVRWSRPGAVFRSPGPLAARLRDARDRADSLAAWSGALADTLLRPFALRRVAALHLALGDSASADRLWALLARERSIWQWEGARARSALALARGDTLKADSVLERADQRDWPVGERAEWLARRIDMRLALGDTASAMAFAGQMIAGFPAVAQAAGALRTLESLRAARGESLPLADEERAAESERLRGRDESALVRWTRIVEVAPGFRAHVKRAALLRDLGRFDEARNAATAALASSRSAVDSAEALMTRAWSSRQAGHDGAALADYRQVIRRDAGRAAIARWVRARFHEERGDWTEARADYGRVAAAGGERAEDASLRAGLMSLAVGEIDSALRWFERGDSEAARFWRGVTLRRTRRASGDSLLRELAALPGYRFYRSAARDTLGVRGWSGARGGLPDARPEPGVRLARALDDLGFEDEAARVLERWADGDARLARAGSPSPGRSSGAWVEAAGVAYRAGRIRQGIRFAQRAVSLLPDRPEAYDWSVWPWAYPPAYDSLFAAWPESASAGGLDRALLRAVAWKESRFDPLARSRSDAVGLLQLKRAAVLDVAGWLRERPPTDAALADPALNLRYGARYLERLLARFGANPPLALAAYNSGSTAAKRWTRLRSIGGDALACEEIDFPETEDYVKTILAVRQAYRELKPMFGP